MLSWWFEPEQLGCGDILINSERDGFVAIDQALAGCQDADGVGVFPLLTRLTVEARLNVGFCPLDEPRRALWVEIQGGCLKRIKRRLFRGTRKLFPETIKRIPIRFIVPTVEPFV